MISQKATMMTLQFVSFANRFGSALPGKSAVFGGCVTSVTNTYAPGVCLNILTSRMIYYVRTALGIYLRKQCEKFILFYTLVLFLISHRNHAYDWQFTLGHSSQTHISLFSHKNTKYLPGLPQTVSVPLCPAFFDKKRYLHTLQ